MHPSIHSLAHRAQPATRTRVRWQPYNSLPSATSTPITTNSPSSTYLNTPASSSSSATPSPTPTLLCEADRIKQVQSQNRDSSQSQSREKSKYAMTLVDQAVKTLSDIWHPQDIPLVFLTSSRAQVPGSADNQPTQLSSVSLKKSQLRNTQLPSPVSPTTETTTSPSSNQCNDSLEALLNPRNVVPVKGFVHEVLRRSRTSGSVLQTALCYLEAIRPKIPELIRLETTGDGVKGELELASRITPATEAELEREAELSSGMPTIFVNDSEDVMDTIKLSDDAEPASPGSDSSTVIGSVPTADDMLKKPKVPTSLLTPLPPLPSPLLCPRRAFLAALILASKFTQDKCYSNRAWAKLSGLPPREIGRCERALGAALEWRLWVGKCPSNSQPAQATSAAPTAKSVTRCQSESNLHSSPSDRSNFLATEKISNAKTSPLLRRSNSGLRRASTLPAEAFTGATSPTSHRYLKSNDAVTQWINGRQQDSSLEDSEMYSPGTGSVCVTESEHIVNQPTYSSPFPPTPGLSYSPSSTESSSSGGDRTIQMTSFLDDTMSMSMCVSQEGINWSMDNSSLHVQNSVGVPPPLYAQTGKDCSISGVEHIGYSALASTTLDSLAYILSSSSNHISVSSDSYIPQPPVHEPNFFMAPIPPDWGGMNGLHVNALGIVGTIGTNA